MFSRQSRSPKKRQRAGTSIRSGCTMIGQELGTAFSIATRPGSSSPASLLGAWRETWRNPRRSSAGRAAIRGGSSSTLSAESSRASNPMLRCASTPAWKSPFARAPVEKPSGRISIKRLLSARGRLPHRPRIPRLQEILQLAQAQALGFGLHLGEDALLVGGELDVAEDAEGDGE